MANNHPSSGGASLLFSGSGLRTGHYRNLPSIVCRAWPFAVPPLLRKRCILNRFKKSLVIWCDRVKLRFMEAHQIIKTTPVKAKPVSGLVKITQVSYRGFAANDPSVYRGCSGSCVYDASVRLFPGQYFDAESELHQTWFRYYDPSLGRFTQSDFIGLADGPNTYLYAYANPLRYTDPTGLAVYLCKQPAFGISWNPLDHYWIKTDSVEAGMGGVHSDCGNAGNASGDPLGDPVQVCDHSQRNKTNATCELVDNVDENKVNEQLKLGRYLGNWWPTNQCQSFARDVLRNASTLPPIPDDGLTWSTP